MKKLQDALNTLCRRHKLIKHSTVLFTWIGKELKKGIVEIQQGFQS